MKKWYGDGNGSWSQMFVFQVHSIRNRFLTKKTEKAGIEVATAWAPYLLQRTSLEVRVTRFEWNNFETIGSGSSAQNWLVFKLNTQIRNPSTSALSSPFWDHLIKLYFPDNYPNGKPSAKVPDFYGKSDSAHEQHIYNDGGLCNLSDENDWDPKNDTALSFFNATLNLLVWHYLNFGW